MDERSRNPLPPDHAQRLERARLSLDGLSVGDGFGECFFVDELRVMERVRHRQEPPPPWFYTDDTAMALSIYRCLERYGQIEPNTLATVFATAYKKDPERGYGGMARAILQAIGNGLPWKQAAGRAFSGMGSMGNGGAMRVAPLGAYFAEDPAALVENALLSACVTHAHPEGQAGAVAVALAAAWAWNHRETLATCDRRDLIRFCIERTPEGDTHTGLRRALEIPFERPIQTVIHRLGNGSQVTAPDTVPFAIWCAARHLGDYPEAIWNTVTAFGDIDTNCAIVGGIVALSGGNPIPATWLAQREDLGLPPAS